MDPASAVDYPGMDYRRTSARLPGTRTAEVFWDGEVLPAVLNDISLGGASLLLPSCRTTGDFLLLLEPEQERPVALYMCRLSAIRKGTHWLVRAKFGQMEPAESEYLANFMEALSKEIREAQLARRLQVQRPA